MLKKEEQLSQELTSFQDVDQAKQDLQQQQLDLEMKFGNLNATLKSTISAVKEAEKRKIEIEVPRCCYYKKLLAYFLYFLFLFLFLSFFFIYMGLLLLEKPCLPFLSSY